MNTAHRLIFHIAVAEPSAYSSGDDLYGFNPHRGQLMPVPEIASGRSKGCRSGRCRKAAQINAGISSLASQASVSLINNQGDVGKTLEDLGSRESVRQLAIAMVTAGALKGIGDTFTVDGKALNTITVKDGFAANAGKNLINGLARATLTSAVTGTDLETSLRTEVIASILNAANAQGANWIGD